MPGRQTPLVTGQIYHVFNRGVARQPTFLNKRNYLRALETLSFYRNRNTPLRFSFFTRLPQESRAEILERMRKERKYFVDILAYCLMPNHFHLLLKQLKDEGTSSFISKATNSYTRYLNSKHQRVGPVFQGKFKAVRIENDEQLIHVNRYIHLNPFASHVIKTMKELEDYPYSSLPEYLGHGSVQICSNIEQILHNFRSKNEYKRFVFDQADYQKELERIRHLTLEK